MRGPPPAAPGNVFLQRLQLALKGVMPLAAGIRKTLKLFTSAACHVVKHLLLAITSFRKKSMNACLALLIATLGGSQLSFYLLSQANHQLAKARFQSLLTSIRLGTQAFELLAETHRLFFAVGALRIVLLTDGFHQLV